MPIRNSAAASCTNGTRSSRTRRGGLSRIGIGAAVGRRAGDTERAVYAFGYSPVESQDSRRVQACRDPAEALEILGVQDDERGNAGDHQTADCRRNAGRACGGGVEDGGG